MSKLFTQLLERRGLTSDFLLPSYEKKSSPTLLPDLDKAIVRLKTALKNQEKILIFGDYDVDGITASTIMYDALKLLGIKKLEIMLPNRFSDGYGMSRKVINYAKEHHFSLIITVDCGSRNHEIVDELNRLRIDTIITDHHECDTKLPNAVAILNPKRLKKGKNNPFYELAGVGVAFELICGLVAQDLIPNGQEKWFLDLVVIGTICDNMKMRGENRCLGFWGMKVLQKTRRIGLKELVKAAGIKRLDSTAIGYQIGPRLNAAGRMESAEIALNLLLSKSAPTAAKLAFKLEELNTLRKKQQIQILDEITGQGITKEPVIITAGDWHEGILGIVAGRLVEDYHRPAFVFTKQGEELKGSGRSFGDFSLAEALVNCKEHIINGGGHAGACGVRLKNSKLPVFIENINHYYRTLNLVDQERFLLQTFDLIISDLRLLSLEFLEELRSLEPYGYDNLEPVFLLEKMFILDTQRLGTDRNHLRLIIRDNKGNTFKLLAFFAPKTWLELCSGVYADFWISLSENDWKGLRSPEGRILKLRVVD